MSDKKLQRWHKILSWTGAIMVMSSCIFSIPCGAGLVKWPSSATFMIIALSIFVIGALLQLISFFFYAELKAQEEVRGILEKIEAQSN